jgi:gliding motility-associated-like protein
LVDVLANDNTSGLANFSVTIVDAPQNGSLTPNGDGTFTYTPAPGYLGSDSWSYRLCSDACPDLCATALVEIQVGTADGSCFMPNIITPNGDGVNDALEIQCLDLYTDNELLVFNRWGDEVYQAQPYLNDWFGTYGGGDLPAGTYFVILRYTETTPTGSQPREMKGYVVIHR